MNNTRGSSPLRDRTNSELQGTRSRIEVMQNIQQRQINDQIFDKLHQIPTLVSSVALLMDKIDNMQKNFE